LRRWSISEVACGEGAALAALAALAANAATSAMERDNPTSDVAMVAPPGKARSVDWLR